MTGAVLGPLPPLEREAGQQMLVDFNDVGPNARHTLQVLDTLEGPFSLQAAIPNVQTQGLHSAHAKYSSHQRMPMICMSCNFKLLIPHLHNTKLLPFIKRVV